MAAATLTTFQATYLYRRGLAFCAGPGRLTTRTAEYAWNPSAQQYEVIAGLDGLRVQHRIGAIWQRGRFRRCSCPYCDRYPDIADEVDVIG